MCNHDGTGGKSFNSKGRTIFMLLYSQTRDKRQGGGFSKKKKKKERRENMCSTEDAT